MRKFQATQIKMCRLPTKDGATQECGGVWVYGVCGEFLELGEGGMGEKGRHPKIGLYLPVEDVHIPHYIVLYTYGGDPGGV